MYIAIANSIGSSSNSGGTPVPTTERYEIQDCIGYSGNFVSNDYPIGEFVEGDRVTFNYGVDAFGIVLNITTNPSSEVDIVGTGINNSNCFDNNVALYASNYLGDNSVEFLIELESVNADFISNNNEYPINVSYYNSIMVLVDVQDDEGDDYYDNIQINWNGAVTFTSYQYEQNGAYEIVFESEFLGDNEFPVNFYNQEIYISVYFVNIDGYTDDDNCPNYAFLRNSGSQAGSSFGMSYRNDDC